MLGIEHRFQRRRTLSPRAPRPSDFPATGSKPSDTSQCHSEQDCRLTTAFRSPIMTSARADSIVGSMFPTCCFASESTSSSARLAGSLHSHCRFAPVAAASLLPTRSGLSARLYRLRFQLPLPFGNFASLGINVSASFAASQPAFRTRPISVRSPQPFFYR